MQHAPGQGVRCSQLQWHRFAGFSEEAFPGARDHGKDQKVEFVQQSLAEEHVTLPRSNVSPAAMSDPTTRPTSSLKYGVVQAYCASTTPSSDTNRPATIFLIVLTSPSRWFDALDIGRGGNWTVQYYN